MRKRRKRLHLPRVQKPIRHLHSRKLRRQFRKALRRIVADLQRVIKTIATGAAQVAAELAQAGKTWERIPVYVHNPYAGVILPEKFFIP